MLKEAYITRYGLDGEVMVRAILGHWRQDSAGCNPGSDGCTWLVGSKWREQHALPPSTFDEMVCNA